MLGGGSGSRFEAGYGLGIRYHNRQAWIDLRLLVPADKMNVQIRITDREGVLNDSELRDWGNSLLFSALDAARENKRAAYWIRRHAMYDGKPLDGWYELPGWRLAPAPEQPSGPEAPDNPRSLQLVVIDAQVMGIDERDALEQARGTLTRRVAHAAFLLAIPLRWLPDQPSVAADAHGGPAITNAWRGRFGAVDQDADPFSNPAQKGTWGHDFIWPWRDPIQGGALDGLRVPQAGLSLLRRLGRNPKASSAFDSASRLYHLSMILPEGFRSASVALTIAAVEALTKGLEGFEGLGDKARFIEFFSRYNTTSEIDPDRVYGRWRSGMFHAGQFARIDGAHYQIDFVDDSVESAELQRIPEAIRRAFAGWVDHLASSPS